MANIANILNNILSDSGVDISTLVPSSRTLTINGTTFDLSVNRSWTVGSELTASSPLSISANVISIAQATSVANGFLSSTDWATFNAKQSALSGTGFVKVSGTTISYDNTTYTPTSRLLTINGTSYDLSADRSWTITPGSGMRNVQTFTATSGQTTFIITGGYTTGLVDVYVNGARLSTSDFTATNGTSVILGVGVVANDIVDIVAYTASATSGITGGGTNGYLSKWTGTSSINGSVIYQNGSNIGIGTVTASEKLEIYSGAASAAFINLVGNGNTAGTSNVVIGQNSDDGAYFWNRKASFISLGTSNAEKMRITSGGKVLIGTSASFSNEQMRVVGSASYWGTAIFENNQNQLDVNHGTINVVNTRTTYAIGNDASIMFSAYNSTLSMQPRASLGMKVSSDLGGELVFNTRNNSGYAERMRIKENGIINFANVPTSSAGLSSGDVYRIGATLMIV